MYKRQVRYYDKYGKETDRPEFSRPLPEGVTKQTVIEGYIEAIGGRDKLEGVKTKTSVSEANMQGMTIQVSNRQTAKKQKLLEVKMMGNVMQKTVLNTSKGYNEMHGQKMEMNDEQFENAIQDAALFPELEVDLNQILLVGIVSVDGKDAYEIKWSNTKTIYYSVENFLKLKIGETIKMDKKVKTNTTTLKDYKSVEGILFPHQISQDMGPQKMDFQVKSITLNEPMSESLFE